MKKYKVTIHNYSYEVKAKNEEEAKLTAEDINWNRVDVEEIKKKKNIEKELENTITSYIDTDRLIAELGGKDQLDFMIKDIITIFEEKEND